MAPTDHTSATQIGNETTYLPPGAGGLAHAAGHTNLTHNDVKGK